MQKKVLLQKLSEKMQEKLLQNNIFIAQIFNKKALWEYKEKVCADRGHITKI
jgi:hypothetical protein